MAFVPKKKSSIKEVIKDWLMKGYIVRYNFIEEDNLEVLDRKYISYLPNMGNIGQCNQPIFATIDASHEVFLEAKKELSEEYSVKCVRCKGSGCCQYTTYGAYLE